MSLPRFSEMLRNRRRQLGLTIGQASRVLKLREDVLEAFESGDFDRCPQSGYAQGMLSSYARYLGLNAREVVDLFQEELYEYVNGSTSHELRQRTRDNRSGRGLSGYDIINEASSRPKAYVEYHPLLPASGGPAGDMGAFATTTSARSRRSVPLAGSGPSAVEAYPETTPVRRPYNSPTRGERAQSSSTRNDRQRRRVERQRRTRDVSDPAGRLLSNDMRGGDRSRASERGLYRRDDVSTRNVRPREYTDDMRYDRARPYESASTLSGRRSSRNIANMDRPNVRRRETSGSSRGASSTRGRQGERGRSSSRRQPARRGFGGAVSEFFSDPRRSLLVFVVVFAVVIIAILSFSVGSCVSNRVSGGSGKTVVVDTVDQTDSGSDTTGTDSSKTQATTTKTDGTATDSTSDQSGSASDNATDGAATTTETYVPTVVKVSVQNGAYTWLEITSDGTSVIADSVTGPWEQEFTVTESITVQAGDPSVVTVTKNGAVESFTSKASGLGSLSIEGTKPPETTDTGDSAEGDGSGEDGSSDVSADGGDQATDTGDTGEY